MSKRTNLLILTGVFDFSESTVQANTTSKQYSQIPKRFTSVATWPKNTNLLCWSCGNSFSDYPKFVAMNPEIKNGDDICDVKGNFCRWPCASNYIDKEMPKSQKKDLHRFLTIFESKFSKRRKEIIPCSPPKAMLKE
jgi:hypothetical protein